MLKCDSSPRQLAKIVGRRCHLTVYFLLSLFVNGASGRTFNESIFAVPGLEVMASNDEKPHFTIIETVSRTKLHRHRREVIAGPLYDWLSYEIPYQIWGGDCESFAFSDYFKLQRVLNVWGTKRNSLDPRFITSIN
ncbi:hypothetical protein WR25_00866 [Diploscapter pachys]|uniref:Uncharacterized protein n=1 Tax=Diploscapter pachys TaxID=2018661 RepID=A0A2A2L1C3_9BILA|nr:hypothetical protein WR25_00866 [Diploscapter pachys]